MKISESLLMQSDLYPVKTFLLNPITGAEMIPAMKMNCMSTIESYAEKFRAALTRKEPAIRDYFDIDHAVREQGFDCFSSEFLSLLNRKLKQTGHDKIDISNIRLSALEKQLSAQLKPFLREIDFREFNLNRSFDIVKKVYDFLSF